MMPDLRCVECDREFRSERGLKGHMAAKHPPQADGYVTEKTLEAVEAASHLGPQHAGVVAVLVGLARTIDGMPQRDSDAPMDNVTVPTYLKYSTELGLTPLSELKLGKPEDRGASKLANLRAIRGGKAS
jgi:hypothetical protein